MSSLSEKVGENSTLPAVNSCHPPLEAFRVTSEDATPFWGTSNDELPLAAVTYEHIDNNLRFLSSCNDKVNSNFLRFVSLSLPLLRCTPLGWLPASSPPRVCSCAAACAGWKPPAWRTRSDIVRICAHLHLAAHNRTSHTFRQAPEATPT